MGRILLIDGYPGERQALPKCSGGSQLDGVDGRAGGGGCTAPDRPALPGEILWIESENSLKSAPGGVRKTAMEPVRLQPRPLPGVAQSPHTEGGSPSREAQARRVPWDASC